jgi:hypothetical protein
MILKSNYLALTLAFLASPLFAASQYERELAQLIAQREKALAEVSEQINRRHQDALNQLLRRAMQSNDLEAAIKIRAALARFLGRWIDGDHDSRLQFLPSSSYEEKWKGGAHEGKWQATSPSEARVTYKKGQVHDFRVSEDGKSLKRLQDGKTWSREN